MAIESQPFFGMKYAIAKPDRRSQDGLRTVYFCSTEQERDALISSAAAVKGPRHGYVAKEVED